MTGITDSRRDLVLLLKRLQPVTVAQLARHRDSTQVAIRQHLAALEATGLVQRTAPRRTRQRGRPADRWVLTDLAVELFPDRHADLTVELLDSIRDALGADALQAVVEERGRRQAAAYGGLTRGLAPDDAVGRARAIAEQRSAEGYMAEVVVDDDGVRLIEHNCPVCEAAAACTGICASEHEVFASALGDGLAIEREQHLLSGDTRCVYRIRSAS